MARTHDTRALDQTEEAIFTLFCLMDDAYAHLNPKGQSVTSRSRSSRTRRFLLSRSSSNSGAWRASDLFSETRLGSSRTCFLGW